MANGQWMVRCPLPNFTFGSLCGGWATKRSLSYACLSYHRNRTHRERWRDVCCIVMPKNGRFEIEKVNALEVEQFLDDGRQILSTDPTPTTTMTFKTPPPKELCICISSEPKFSLGLSLQPTSAWSASVSLFLLLRSFSSPIRIRILL
jgi:hypothetical protein